ncbi:MAG: RidA family protein [Thermoanaerobaculia bacterium]
MSIQKDPAGLGIHLPEPPPPAGNYQPVTTRNGLGFVSGQVPIRDGRLLFTGRVGAELTPQQGKAAAEIAALNVLAQIDRAIPSWEQFGGLLRVEGYVASASGFTSQPEILDGASDLFVDVLGELGQHSRAAFSVEQLPLNASFELVVTFASQSHRPSEQE